MLHKTLVIGRVRAMEYGGLATHRTAGAKVVLETRAGRRHIKGFGESSFGTDTATRDAGWAFLTEAIEAIANTTIGLDRRDPASGVATLLGDLEHRLPDTANPTEDLGQRSALAAVEMALLDAAGRAASVPMARVLGGKRRSIRINVRQLSPPYRVQQVQAAASANPNDIVALVGVGGLDQALGALDVVTKSRVTASVVLDVGGVLSTPEAAKLIETIVDRMAAGELTRRMFLQQPTASGDLDAVAELQTDADRLAHPLPERSELTLMPALTSNATGADIADRRIRAVHLVPDRLGGATRTLGLARDIVAAQPETFVALSGATGSGVGARALAELAAAFPRLDAFSVTPDEVDGTIQVRPPVKIATDTQISAGRGPGLGCSADMTRLVGRMTRYTEAPPPPRHPVTYGSLDANTFDMASLHGFGRDGSWDLTMISHMLERSALAHGLPTVRESGRILLVHHDDLPFPVGFYSSRTNWSSSSAMSVTSDKDLTRRLLAEAGVATPAGAAFGRGEEDKALAYAESLDGPVVVKPVRGSHGDGVATDLRTRSDIKRAISAIMPKNSTESSEQVGRLLVEQCVNGDDYRFLVVGDQVVSVVLKRPASVVGDGRSSVLDLVIQKNDRKLQNPHACRRLIKLEENAAFWLKRQNLTIDSVPAAGQHIRLSSAANGSLGADTIEVLDETHESLCEMAVRATQAIPGLDVAGVDLMVADHRRAADEQSAAVIEVNGEPGTALNHYPFFGPPRDVSSQLLRRSFDLAGVTLRPPSTSVKVRITVEGTMPSADYMHWFESTAREHGVTVAVKQQSPGMVIVFASGTTQSVATVASRSFAGPFGRSVARVRTSHAEPGEASAEFEVHE